MEKVGIKESMELLEGVKVLGVAAKKVLKDGKVNLADLGILMAMVQEFAVLTAAIQGVDQVVVEAKDLSMDEVNKIMAKLMEVTAAIKAA